MAEKREEWFKGQTLTGCANDIHGPFRGPDGWIYWCKGAFAEQTYERPGKPPLVTRAAHIFRARPDGTGIEPVMTGGMDNPVELVFTPGGERIFTTTFFQHPGGGQRDGLIHAIYGGVYGKQHDVLAGHVRTGPDLMPVLTQLGPAAPCGLARLESSSFVGHWDNLAAALFNLHKVTLHELVEDGSTFGTKDSDLLTAADFDFHPTDVLQDADGSLLVVDTGGWYKLCCPTSQLVKPDVLGAIYRVRQEFGGRKYSAAVRQKVNDSGDPWGKKIDWPALDVNDLQRRLNSDRPAVARRAADEMVRRPADTPAVLTTGLLTVQSVWILTRIDQPAARQLVRSVLAETGRTYAHARHAAILSAGLWRDAQAAPLLIDLLATGSPANRRAAAEALGRIGDPAAVPALLAAVAKAEGDRVLEHSLIYALIEIGDPEGVRPGLASQDVPTRRAALIALDQMPGDRLAPETLSEFLASDDLELSDAATWIAGLHPDWADKLASFYRRQLYSDDVEGVRFVALERQLAVYAGAESIQDLLAERLGDVTASDVMCRFVLQTMAQARVKMAPASWIGPVRRALASRHPAVAAEAVRTARALKIPADETGSLGAALVKIARDEGRDLDLRLDALAAVPGGLPTVEADTLALLRAQLADDQPVGRRLAAADILAKATLSADQLIELADDLAAAGPLEIDKLLAAFARSQEPRVGTKLVGALEKSRRAGAPRRDAQAAAGEIRSNGARLRRCAARQPGSRDRAPADRARCAFWPSWQAATCGADSRFSTARKRPVPRVMRLAMSAATSDPI